jgi:hypothetical protein
VDRDRYLKTLFACHSSAARLGRASRRFGKTSSAAPSKVRVESFTISLDGYGAGASQSIEQPLGYGGEQLHDWLVETRTFRSTYGEEGGAIGANDDFASRCFANVGGVDHGPATCSVRSAAEPVDGASRVLVPGQREFEVRADREANGVALHLKLIERLDMFADDLGIEHLSR